MMELSMKIAEFAAVAVTCRRVCGLVCPIPTCPVLETKRAELPVDVATFITAPAPSCWTVSAVPLVVLPRTMQLLELMSVFTLGAPCAKLI